jgi:hypothetical protein
VGVDSKSALWLRRLQEKGVGADQEWQGILRRPLFADAGDSASASLAHLTDIFVERQHLLWKVCRLLACVAAPLLMKTLYTR